MQQVLLSPNQYNVQLMDDQIRVNKASRRNTILLVILLVISSIALGFSIRANFKNNDNSRQFPNPDYVANLKNISDVKNSLIKYYEGNDYTQELNSLAVDFNKYVTHNSKTFEHSKKPIVVFDIDETLINNYDHYVTENFMYNPVTWKEWVKRGDAPPLQPIVDIVHALNEKNIAVALITGREEVSREPTLKNLKHVGLTEDKYEMLILRNEEETKLSASEFKMKRRKEMSKDFSVVGCLGDQYSDCSGGYTGYAVKLPNYVYFIA